MKFEVTKAGNFHLNPVVLYMDEMGRKKTFKANPIAVNAQLAKPTYEALPGRVSTGTLELDSLLPRRHTGKLRRSIMCAFQRRDFVAH